MKSEDKSAAIKAELMTLTEENEDVVDFLIERQADIFASFDAGKVKKEVNPKAAEGLAKWRAGQKRLKEAGEAAPVEETEEEEEEEVEVVKPKPKPKAK